MLKGLEFRRKILHILFGLSLIIMIYFGLLRLWHLAFIFLFGFAISMLSKRFKLPFIHKMLLYFDRNEKNIPGKGILTFILGVMIAWAVFFKDKDIVLASIFILTLGDAFSSLFSRYYGRIRMPFNNYKLLEGYIIGVIVGFIGAVMFVSILEAFIGSTIAMFIEAVGIRLGKEYIDDNLIIPITAGIIIYLVRIFL
jgi:dolichol kinase